MVLEVLSIIFSSKKYLGQLTFFSNLGQLIDDVDTDYMLIGQLNYVACSGVHGPAIDFGECQLLVGLYVDWDSSLKLKELVLSFTLLSN